MCAEEPSVMSDGGNAVSVAETVLTLEYTCGHGYAKECYSVEVKCCEVESSVVRCNLRVTVCVVRGLFCELGGVRRKCTGRVLVYCE